MEFAAGYWREKSCTVSLSSTTGRTANPKSGSERQSARNFWNAWSEPTKSGRNSGSLFPAGGIGQQRFEIFPESDRDFFYTIVDAVITFDTDGQANAAQLTLHQNGADMVGKRVP